MSFLDPGKTQKNSGKNNLEGPFEPCSFGHHHVCSPPHQAIPGDFEGETGRCETHSASPRTLLHREQPTNTIFRLMYVFWGGEGRVFTSAVWVFGSPRPTMGIWPPQSKDMASTKRFWLPLSSKVSYYTACLAFSNISGHKLMSQQAPHAANSCQSTPPSVPVSVGRCGW